MNKNASLYLFLSLCLLASKTEAVEKTDAPSEAQTMTIEVPPTPKEALIELFKGNERHIKNLHENNRRDQERRTAISTKQTPFAIIVGCSDSRVAPEIIFDQGLGDIFVVRVAGNVVGPIGLSSVEYSAEYLHSPLILVLGHENCGAVKAVLAGQTLDIEPIAVKVEAAIKEYSSHLPNKLEDAVKANVRAVVEQLKKAPPIAKLIKENKLDVVGGYYELDSGKVTLCCEPMIPQDKNK